MSLGIVAVAEQVGVSHNLVAKPEERFGCDPVPFFSGSGIEQNT